MTTFDLWEAHIRDSGCPSATPHKIVRLLPSELTPCEARAALIARTDLPETACGIEVLSLTLVHPRLEIPR